MIDRMLIKRAMEARRRERATTLSLPQRRSVAAQLACHFVAHSESLEGHQTTPADVRRSAEEYA
jgi:Fic family protein